MGKKKPPSQTILFLRKLPVARGQGAEMEEDRTQGFGWKINPLCAILGVMPGPRHQMAGNDHLGFWLAHASVFTLSQEGTAGLLLPECSAHARP